MKIKLLISSLLILSLFYSKAQNQFQKLVGTGYPGEAHSFCISQEGNYVAACAGSLIKVDTNSTVVWVKKYLSPLMYNRSYVIRQSNNGYLVIYDIISGGVGSDDIMVFNTDSAGQIEWIKVFGTTGFDIPADVKEMPNGDFIICGQTNGFDMADKDMLMMRISKVGEQLWQRTYGTASDDDHAEKLIAAASGHLIMAGAMSGQICLTKTSTDGELSWSKIYGFGCLYDIIEDPARGDLYVCGSLSEDNSKSGVNLFVMCTDSSGNVIWAKLIGNNAGETAYSVSANSDFSQIYLAGKEQPDSACCANAIALSLQCSNGSINWSHKYGTMAADIFYDNCLLNGNTVVNAGFSNYSDSVYHNLYIVKTTINGISGCNQTPYVPQFDSLLNIVVTDIPIVADSGDMTVITKCFPPSYIPYYGLALCSNAVPDLDAPSSLPLLYPNPVSGGADISLPNGGYVQYQLFDAGGSCIKTVPVDGRQTKLTISSASLPQGVYLLKLIKSNSSYQTLRFVVQ